MADNREIIMEALLLQDKGEYADKIIKSILDKYAYLEKFEKSFINRVFTGTIERKLYLDYVINNFSTVKVNKQKPVIRAILRMSAYQLLFMDSVPDSAVVNEAVKLAKRKKFNGLTGFINGVLRKIAKEKDNIVLPDKDTGLVKYLSVVYSAPEWLCEHFISETGEEKAEEILANSLVERPIIIRTNISKISTEELKSLLQKEGVEVRDIEGYKDALIIENVEGLSSIESFGDGLFCVQDLSSQRVISDYIDETSKIYTNAELIVDVCAAPGGKTCHVADIVKYYKNDKCKIISRDLTDIKADRIDENVERCGFMNVTTQVWDALTEDTKLTGKADVVIADLPCSGLGVIGRKADIKYRITEDDLHSLCSLQRDILSVVSKYVKPGGMLIFSTCTVNRLENSENVKWILKNLPFKQYKEEVQIYNDRPQQDGFFISRFIREE